MSAIYRFRKKESLYDILIKCTIIIVFIFIKYADYKHVQGLMQDMYFLLMFD